MNCDPVNLAEYLKSKFVVYDYKVEFKREFEQLCEGCSCGSGKFESFLISTRDVSEFKRIIRSFQ